MTWLIVTLPLFALASFQIQDHLRVLQQQYDDSVHQRESLRERKVLTTLRLKRASVLIAALADEEVCKKNYVLHCDRYLR